MVALLPLNETSVRTAVFSAGAAALVALGAAIYSAHTSWVLAERQVSLDLTNSFVSSSGELSLAGGQFIAAVNQKKGLASAKIKLNDAVLHQIRQIPRLEQKLHLNEDDAASYKVYLSQLIELTNAVQSPEEMPQWAEGFGRVLDSDTVLTKRFYEDAGKSSSST